MVFLFRYYHYGNMPRNLGVSQMIKLVFIKMGGYSADFMREACNVIERALQAEFKERIKVIAIDEEIRFIDKDEIIEMINNIEIPESLLIKCPHCEIKFLKVEILLQHLEREHKDKKH